MEHASSSEHNYFHRIAQQNRDLPVDKPPESLAEMFERMERLQRQMGELAETALEGTDVGDLKSHLNYLKRLRIVDHSHST